MMFHSAMYSKYRARPRERSNTGNNLSTSKMCQAFAKQQLRITPAHFSQNSPEHVVVSLRR